MPRPSFSELCAHDASRMLADHLSACPRCRGLEARLDGSEPALARAPATVAAPAAADPPPRPGGVWAFWAPKAEEYLVGAVLDAGETDVLVVPVLEQTIWAADADIGLSADVLGYKALAAVWASDRVLVEQAVEAVDVLSEEHVDQLAAGYDAFLAGVTIPESAGPPVLADDDPRLAAHAATADGLRAFYRPWALLNMADELGPVMEHRREDVGMALDEFSERLDLAPTVWAAFEAAQADPVQSVPVKALARAVRELDLVVSRRVLALADASVRAHYVPPAQAVGIARARRRRGVTSRSRQGSRAATEEAKAAAESYVARFAEELGL
jgi:hypothetical protein